MEHANNNDPANRPARRKRRTPTPLTLEELEYLKIKRFIDELDVMRFFGISESTMYKWIQAGHLQPVRIGSKKLFDLQAIYARMERKQENGK